MAKRKKKRPTNLKEALGPFKLRSREEIARNPGNRADPYYTSTLDALMKGIIKD